MRALPNFRVLSPTDHVTSGSLFDVCIENQGPKYIRLDAQVLPVVYGDAQARPNLDAGYGVLRQGAGICIISTGYMTHTALKVAERLADEGIDVTLVDLFDITGFARESLISLIAAHDGLVTMEEGFRGRGGLDSMFFEIAARENLRIKHLNIGVDGGYHFELGTRSQLHEKVGIGESAVLRMIQNFAAGL